MTQSPSRRGMTRGPFLKGPEKFSHPESHRKISNLMITELFYSIIFLIWTEVPFIQSFRPIHVSVFKIQIPKNGFAGPKRLQGFRETRPRASLTTYVLTHFWIFFASLTFAASSSLNLNPVKTHHPGFYGNMVITISKHWRVRLTAHYLM